MSSQGSYMTILQEFHGAVLVEVRKIWRPWPRSRRGPWEWRLRRSWWNPARGPCMISFRSLTLSCTGPYQKILWRSWWDPLYKVLAWGACRCHILEVLLWKLLWEALGRILYQDLARSAPAAGPCIQILTMLCIGACMKVLRGFSLEILAGSSKEILAWWSCKIL